jgi:hypothetical protein
MTNNDAPKSNVELVADAIRDGRIQPARAQFWSDALDADPAGARAILDMLMPTPDYLRPQAAVRNRPAVRNQASPAPAAAQPTPRSETFDQMNSRINSDPELQAIAWEMGIRDGIEPPPVVYVHEPEYEAPWDPKPRVVENADGSTEWVFPEPDHTGTMLDENNWDSRYSNARGGALESNLNRLRRQDAGDDSAREG